MRIFRRVDILQHREVKRGSKETLGRLKKMKETGNLYRYRRLIEILAVPHLGPVLIMRSVRHSASVHLLEYVSGEG